MRRSKATELRGLSEIDLNAKAKEINEDIFKTRMQIATGGITNKHEILNKRRVLARVKTILNEKRGGNK
ncbi:MAG: 50S ribosomal protein L29 [Proteobacteria bacterium]|nr:50S ribosomal protein L29 [Pseudomonadota bacterium]